MIFCFLPWTPRLLKNVLAFYPYIPLYFSQEDYSGLLSHLVTGGANCMMQVNVLEAKTDFSKLIRLIETNREDEIRVARNGRPVVKITAIEKKPVSRRIGVAEGKFTMPDNFDADNDYITDLFMKGSL